MSTVPVATTAIGAVATTAGGTTVGVTGRAGRRGRACLAGLALAAAVFAATPLPGQEREIEIRVSRKGYEPDALTLRVGEAVRIVLVSGDGEEHCFAVDELRVEKRVRARGPTRFALVPDRTGVFAMHCCLGDSSTAHRAERGEVTVTE